jgi:signal transduction histidine kinase/CheY-like chemotaxis protein
MPRWLPRLRMRGKARSLTQRSSLSGAGDLRDSLNRVVLEESWRTERVINLFRGALWTGIGAITVFAEYQQAGEVSLGAALALGWGLVCLGIASIWRARPVPWLPWVLTSSDITVVGLCMFTGYVFAQRFAPAVVPHQIYGSGFVMMVVVASNMLRFSPWISLWSTAYAAWVYLVILERTLGTDPLSFVEIVLVAVLGAMLVYSARKLSVIVRQEREHQEALRQAQKLETVGQITGGVAQVFMKLLSVILGNAELLQESQPHGSPDHELSQTIVAAAQRGALLTRRLLAYARRQTLEVADLDLNRLVGGMANLLERTLGEHIEIVIEREDALWHVMADASQLENALLNLALNSRDAMPKGGRLAIATRNATLGEAETALHAEAKPGEYVLLSVTDTGCGMEPAIVRCAFDPFFTTKEVGKGSGLGLSMVYGFVRQSGGHVRIESEPDRGTAVSMYLPRFTGAQAAEPTPLPSFDRVPAGAETVLVVEDDPLVRGHVVALLEDLGYTVVAADHGKAALAALDTNRQVRLLFTDVVMPGGMNGPQLAAEARRRQPGLKVLLTSGYADALTGERPELPLLPKPYRKPELARKVREVLDAAS